MKGPSIPVPSFTTSKFTVHSRRLENGLNVPDGLIVESGFDVSAFSKLIFLSVDEQEDPPRVQFESMRSGVLGTGLISIGVYRCRDFE